MATRECSLPGVRKRSNDNKSRDTKLTFRRTDLKTIGIRGEARHCDVAITHPKWLGKTTAALSQRQPVAKNRSIAHTGAMKRTTGQMIFTLCHGVRKESFLS